MSFSLFKPTDVLLSNLLIVVVVVGNYLTGEQWSGIIDGSVDIKINIKASSSKQSFGSHAVSVSFKVC